MLRIVCALVTMILGLAVSAAAAPADAGEPDRLRDSARRAVSLLDHSDRLAPVVRPAPRGWVRRHPIATAAIIGGGSGFLIGYLPGDDGVFYDYTAGFNGLVIGGIGAGAGASLVAIVRALRR